MFKKAIVMGGMGVRQKGPDGVVKPNIGFPRKPESAPQNPLLVKPLSRVVISRSKEVYVSITSSRRHPAMQRLLSVKRYRGCGPAAENHCSVDDFVIRR
jgi:hypothetical protein